MDWLGGCPVQFLGAIGIVLGHNPYIGHSGRVRSPRAWGDSCEILIKLNRGADTSGTGRAFSARSVTDTAMVIVVAQVACALAPAAFALPTAIAALTTSATSASAPTAIVPTHLAAAIRRAAAAISFALPASIAALTRAAGPTTPLTGIVPTHPAVTIGRAAAATAAFALPTTAIACLTIVAGAATRLRLRAKTCANGFTPRLMHGSRKHARTSLITY